MLMCLSNKYEKIKMIYLCKVEKVQIYASNIKLLFSTGQYSNFLKMG